MEAQKEISGIPVAKNWSSRMETGEDVIPFIDAAAAETPTKVKKPGESFI